MRLSRKLEKVNNYEKIILPTIVQPGAIQPPLPRTKLHVLLGRIIALELSNNEFVSLRKYNKDPC